MIRMVLLIKDILCPKDEDEPFRKRLNHIKKYLHFDQYPIYGYPLSNYYPHVSYIE